MKILVTPRSFGKTNPELFDRLAQAGLEVVRNDTGGILSADQMREKLASCQGVILGVDPMDASVLAAAPELKAIAKYEGAKDDGEEGLRLQHQRCQPGRHTQADSAEQEGKLTKADGTGYTYTTSGKEETKNYSSRMGLLASGDVKQSFKTEETETLAQTGKSTVSITRGREDVNRTDTSGTVTLYGSETVTAATGTTTVAKKEVDVTDKFGTFESSTLSRTETKVAADKSSTVNTKTRAESVDGVVLTSTQTNTDAAGKATTTESKTTIDANSVTTNHVVAERITLQGGKDLQGEINRIDSRVNQLNSHVDDVQKTAYRGIAIALAAQQAVPNIAPGQVAVFGGVGHYEGETAGSIGVVTSFTDRISASGAFGFAGGNEFGGRVGVAYVFGGK